MTKGKTPTRKVMAVPAAALSVEQQELRDATRAKNMARPPRPRAKLELKDGNLNIEPGDGQDEKLYGALLYEALGTRSEAFLNDTLDNVIRTLSPQRKVTNNQYNAAVALLAAVEPQNEVEATLAAQMVTANDCAMRCMRGMAATNHVDHHKMYGDLANKFLRTFTAQVEALAKLRRKGEQVVKHIHVHEGGQAVVAGTINQGGRGSVESGKQPYGADTVARNPALPGPDPARDGMQLPGDAERALSPTRWEESGRSGRESECVEAWQTIGGSA